MPVGKNKEKKYDTIVAKSPSLLLCKHTMSLMEKKLFDQALVMLKNDYESPGGVLQIPEGRQVEVSIPAKVIKEKLGLSSTNIYSKLYVIADNYSKIRFALKKDANSTDVSDGAFEFMTPFPYSKYENGVFTMRFESGLNKEIANLSAGNYALSDTAFTSKFTKKAAADMYDIISWYRWRGGFTISLTEFRTLLGLDMEVKDEKGNIKTIHKYASYKRLNSDIIKPGIEEINEVTDLIVTVEPVKQGKQVTHLIFTIQKKEEKVATDNGQEVILTSNPLGEPDESITSNARILKMIIKDEDITENDVVIFLMLANGNQELVVEKWQMYHKQKMTREINNPVGWIISAIQHDYQDNVEDVEPEEIIDVSPASEDEKEDEMLDEVSELLSSYEKRFKIKDIRAIIKQAGNDISRIQKAYEVLKANKNVEDHVAFMIAAIRDGYDPAPKKNKREAHNTFLDFPQRKYTQEDYEEIERRKLGMINVSKNKLD